MARGGPASPIGVGFLGYDLGRRSSGCAGRPGRASGWPELEFRFYDAALDPRGPDGRGADLGADAAAAARCLAARLWRRRRSRPLRRSGPLGPSTAASRGAITWRRAADPRVPARRATSTR